MVAETLTSEAAARGDRRPARLATLVQYVQLLEVQLKIEHGKAHRQYDLEFSIYWGKTSTGVRHQVLVEGSRRIVHS